MENIENMENARLVIHYADGDGHYAPFEALVDYIMSTDCVESIEIVASDWEVVRTIKIEK